MVRTLVKESPRQGHRAASESLETREINNIAVGVSAERRGDIKSAARSYRRGVSQRPGLAWMYRQNLSRLRRRSRDEVPRVVLSLCSIPEREQLLEKVLDSLAPQVDEIQLYLDGYEEPPKYLARLGESLATTISGPLATLRDNAKFRVLGQTRGAYCFTADDDIRYPPDYVEAMIDTVEEYGRQAVIGVHGFVLQSGQEKYFSSERSVRHFNSELSEDQPVSGLGTGTIAFYADVLSRLRISDFGVPGMTDLYLAILCKRLRIPMVAVSRKRNWLTDMSRGTPTLYDEFKSADRLQSALMRAHRPWGRPPITSALDFASRKTSCCQARRRLHQLAAGAVASIDDAAAAEEDAT